MTPTDEQLYLDLCRGSAKAFDVFYARYEKRLYGFILGYVRCPEDAEDIFHDVFQGLIQRTRSGGEAPQAVASWLFTVARNRCLNHQRAVRPSGAAVEEVAAETATAEEQLVASRRAEALGRCVGRLPPRLGKVYGLRMAGLSYDDMARELDVPVGTVKSRVHHLVRFLRKDLKQWLAK